MALSSRASFISSSSSKSPFPHKQSPKNVKLNQIQYNSIFTPEKWSITHQNTSASSSSSLVTLPDQLEPSTKDDFGIKQHEQKLREFKDVLRRTSCEDAFEGLIMIDAIQRLGIEYTFQEEIDEILQRRYYNMVPTTKNLEENDLHEIALLFRLLRQDGYYMLPGVFNDFKDKEVDIKGLMALYEASQLSIVGEDILDEAEDYTYKLLNSLMENLDYTEPKLVKNTLEFPHHKSLAQFMAKNFIADYQKPKGWTNELQELANFDCKMVQSQYKQEVLQLSRWWKEVGLSEELKLARNQPLKWYIWSMGTLTDPSFSEQRIDLTKSISFIYLLDDIFDVYGTLDQLTLLTQVVNKWDMAAAEQLPNYMKICFMALDNITNEISYKIYKKHGFNPVESLRKTWAKLCNAFLVEAKWFDSGKLPSAEEYLENGIISSGVHIVLVHIFFLLGHENLEFIENNPSIISSTATILRLWDDLGSAKDEDQDGNDGSYVECYMKENEGCSVEKARNEVKKMISNAWKKLNEESLLPNTTFSSSFSKACLNLARMVPLMYSYDENQCLPLLENPVKSIFS